MSILSAPRTEKGRRTRDRIVAIAARLISEQGVARTSLDDVGTAARVGKSQLYHYFADKDGLVESVIDHQIGRILDDERLGALDTFEGWTAWRDAVVAAKRRLQGTGGCPIGSLAAELADTDEAARLALEAGFEHWEARFRTGIVAMIESGTLRPDADAARLAITVLAAFQGGMLLARLRRDVAPLEVALDGAIEQLRRYAT